MFRRDRPLKEIKNKIVLVKMKMKKKKKTLWWNLF